MQDKKLIVFGVGLIAFLTLFYLVFFVKEKLSGQMGATPDQKESQELLRDFSQWKPITSQLGGFTASFPKTPGHSSEAVPLDGTKEQGVYYLYVAQEPDGSGVMVRTVRYPKGYVAGKEQSLIENSFDQIVNSDNRNVAREVIRKEYEGNPALVFEVENPDVIVKGESILAGDFLYTVMYVTRANLYDEKVWEYILSSFKIEKK